MAQRAKEKHTVKLEWDEIEGLPTIFANQIAVTHASGEEFYLVFGEVSPPTEMFRHEKTERVLIRPVAKIAIPPGSMLRIAQVIQNNAQNFLDKTRPSEDPDAESPN